MITYRYIKGYIPILCIIVLIVLIVLITCCILYSHFTDSHFTDSYILMIETGIKVKKSRIYPLQKYDFYDLQLYGPHDKSIIYDIYGKDVLTHGMRQYSKNKSSFKLRNFEPAKLTGNHVCSQDTKRCGFYLDGGDGGPEYMTPPCCASHLYELLKFTTDLFHKNNIEYMLMDGTLLGSIRHNGIIPWDTDIDIGVYDKYFKSIMDLKDKFNDKLYNIVVEGEVIKIYYSKVNLLHIDIEKIKDVT